MTIFAFESYGEMALNTAFQLEDAHIGSFERGRFPNGELFIRLRERVEGRPCLVIGSVAPPEHRLAESLMLCDTLAANGASSITAFFPYLAYSRQDKSEPGMSLAAPWVGRLLQASGVTEVWTVDLHSSRTIDRFPIPLVSFSPAPVFAPELKGFLKEGWTLVAPDDGAIDRCLALGAACGCEFELARFDKKRTAAGVESQLVGPVSDRAFIFDDILDTGGTLIACCRGLRKSGVRRIRVAVTHGLFTGTEWQELWGLGVERILCSDTVRPMPADDFRIHVLSSARALVGHSILKEPSQYVKA